MKKVGVVGSRSFSNKKLMEEALSLLGEFILISGGARGADTLAEQFADQHGFQKRIYPAEWSKYGKMAGYIRNRIIVEDSDFIVAFWNGKSSGTKSTIDIARRLHKEVIIISF